MRNIGIGSAAKGPVLAKCPTGIAGLDEITGGGLPRGRPTLVCGGAGCGKTLFGIEFLTRGALQFNEPGVCLSFEESAEDLAENSASLGFNLKALIKAKKILIDHVQVDRHRISETGDYDLEALFIRLNSAIDAVGAKRVLLDTIESLFAGLSDEGVLRSELQRLFRWLKDKGVTAVITGEQGSGSLTRYGLEEYVSDCVILLDHRVQDSVVTRRLRIVKYRGATHGTNEYPFLIAEDGIWVMPLTSVGLTHEVSEERVSSGIPGLDEMLDGKGFYRGSTIMASGTAGTGKTSMAAHFVDAACRRGEIAVFFSFEESPSQLMRNMRSIGIDLQPWIKKGLLHISATRPSMYGLEMHLAQMHKLLNELHPSVVVVDPMSSLLSAGPNREVKVMLLRLIDQLKNSGATAFLMGLTGGGQPVEGTEVEVSSLVDTWLLLRDVEREGEKNRLIYVLKSRGMAHSNQVREFNLTNNGVILRDAYVGPGGALTGSARIAQEAREREQELDMEEEMERNRNALEWKLRSLESQIIVLQSERESHQRELVTLKSHQQTRLEKKLDRRTAVSRSRQVGRAKDNGPVHDGNR